MKARQLLGEEGTDVAERRYFQEKPTEAEIRELAALLPGDVREILSTRSRKYKELGLAGKELTEDELVTLLSQEPGLWRRPIVVRGDKVVVGYDREGLEELLS